MKTPFDPLWPAFAREAIEGSENDLPSEAARRRDAALVEVVANVGAALGRASAPASSRDRLLAAVRRPPVRYAPLYDRLMGLFDLDEPALIAHLERSNDPAAWEPFLPGVHAFHFRPGPRVSEADAGLVRVEAGVTFPGHRHLGPERVLLLEGSYRDSTGVVYQAGDVHEMAKDSRHSYQVSPDSPVVIAVVLYGGVEILGG
jgi:hypothetical protein